MFDGGTFDMPAPVPSCRRKVPPAGKWKGESMPDDPSKEPSREEKIAALKAKADALFSEA
jgi:hypothetical protein